MPFALANCASVPPGAVSQAAAVPRSDFQRIEHLIRKGEKQLKLLQNDRVSSVAEASV